MRSDFARAAILLSLSAAALAQTAALARRPYLQNVRPDGAVVMWTTTGEAGAGRLRYFEEGVAPREVESKVTEWTPEQTGLARVFYQHRAELPGLRANTRYFYRLLVGGADPLPNQPPADLSFITAGPPPFDFLVFGDSGDGGMLQFSLARQIVNEPVQFAIHTGDVAYDEGRFEQYDRFYFQPYWPLMRRAAMFPVPGNHDYGFVSGRAYLAVHDPPAALVPEADRGRYYSFDWGNVHFAAVDSNDPLVAGSDGSGEMLRWLEQDLAATRQTFRVVYFHHPPFPTAVHRENGLCSLALRHLTPILERHGVHLVFSGHEHIYQRTQSRRDSFRGDVGTVYITTGGAGSSVYEPGRDGFIARGAGESHYLRVSVTGTDMIVRAIGLGHKTLDEFRVTPEPRLAREAIVDAAGGRPRLAPGGLVSIYGSDLAPATSLAGSFPMPRQLDQTQVTVGGRPVPLLFVSRNQVNAQLPYGLRPGPTTLRIETALGAVERDIRIEPSAPAVFLIPSRYGMTAAALHADGSPVNDDRPAARGEWIAVYLTGLGVPDRNIEEGIAAPAAPPARAAMQVRVEVGGDGADVAFAGLAPGFAGVAQINFRVPAGIPDGTATLRVAAGAGMSAAVSIPIAGSATAASHRRYFVAPAALAHIPGLPSTNPH
jgi:uncharacterized protein (TIGR03437 family)